jgi:hypothetical protein
MPKLRLNVTHTHAGIAYPAGSLIEVDAHNARWLIDRNLAELARPDAEPTAPEPVPAVVPSAQTSPRQTKSIKE